MGNFILVHVPPHDPFFSGKQDTGIGPICKIDPGIDLEHLKNSKWTE